MWTLVLVLFFVALGLGVVFVAMRSGSKGPVLDSGKRGSRRALAIGVGLVVVVCGAAIPVVVGIAGAESDAEAGPVSLTASETHGREVFNDRCVQCHSLGASSAVQRIGPDLDALRPPKELVVDAIEKGRARGRGQMPAQLVSNADADDIAAYIARVAGRD